MSVKFWIVVLVLFLALGSVLSWTVLAGRFAVAESPGDAGSEERDGASGSDSLDADSNSHGEKPGHAEHPVERIVTLSPEQMRENGVEVGEAGPGELSQQLALPGAIALNADRVAHVVPRVAGVVREVLKSAGSDVKAGEVMAVLDSRELATLKADYLGARERESMARATFEREKGLWEKKISAEQDYLAAKQALAEAVIATRSAEQQLHAIGFSEEYVKGLPGQAHLSYTRYEVTAPFDGSVIEKHITLGESLKDDAPCFVVADLGAVWADLHVYQKDLSSVRKGEAIVISANADPKEGVSGTVSFVGPVMGEETRSAIARVVLDNDDGRWRPGQFVTGFVVADRQAVAILVPKSALQTLEKIPCVFVQDGGGFVATPVTLGRMNDTYAEVAAGLTKGQRYAVSGTSVMKAVLEKGELHDEH